MMDFELFICLADGKIQSASCLAQKLCVSTKTIYRHANNLVCMGLPIDTLSGKNGGIILRHNRVYNLQNLDKQELMFIYNLLCQNNSRKSKLIATKILNIIT